jgi:orotate phosphoribosyltransferase
MLDQSFDEDGEKNCTTAWRGRFSVGIRVVVVDDLVSSVNSSLAADDEVAIHVAVRGVLVGLWSHERR